MTTRRLDDIEDVKRALSYCIRRMEAGSLDDKIGRALIYGYSTMADLIRDLEMKDLQGLITELRARVDASPAAIDSQSTQ